MIKSHQNKDSMTNSQSMGVLPDISQGRRLPRSETFGQLPTERDDAFSSPPAPNRSVTTPNATQLPPHRIDRGELEPDPTISSPQSSPSSPPRKRDKLSNIFSKFK